MLFPDRMSKVNILVFSRYIGALTEALGRSGLIHLVSATQQSKSHLLQRFNTDGDIRTAENALARCNVLLEALGVDGNDSAPVMNSLRQNEVGEVLETIDHRYRECAERIAKLVAEQTELKHGSQTLAAMPFQSINAGALRNLSQLSVIAGTIDEQNFLHARQTLSDSALFVQSNEAPDQVLVLTTRKRFFAVNDMLNKFGFKKFDFPEELGADGTIAQQREVLEECLAKLRDELNAARLAVVALAEEYGGVLLALRHQLETQLAIRKAQGFFGQSRQLYCISGWLPTASMEQLQKIVDAKTDETGVIEDITEQAEGTAEEEVPVQLNQNSLVRPFQALVTNFGMPNYHEIDPSIFVAITFVLMFGYMFGDLGQGAVLVAVGALMKFRKAFSEQVRDYGVLLMCCGVSAMFFGSLYGSVFGFEELFKPLWLSPLHTTDIPRLLLTAVGIGIVFLSISLLINVINHFRARRFFDGVFDQYGVLGIAFYWMCLVTALTVVFARRVYSWQIYLIVAPLVLIFLRVPIMLIFCKRHGEGNGEKESILNIVLEGAINVMETLTGYLSGTVSFVRVGAFAISHAALCMAVFTIMHLVGTIPGGTAFQVLIAIAGNLLVICFEGMVAAIQCVRLEYYEMFVRYFQGGGKPYQPFKLKNK
jgi:V/A-type H+/Na+-transporting ATPase subunit I